MSITNSKKYQRLGDKDGNPLNGGKTLTHGGGRTYAQDLALQEQHRQLIEKILSGDMQSGLVFTCQIGGLPEETFQVTQFDLQEGISQLFTLSIQAVSPLSEIDFNDVLGMASSLTVKRDGHILRTVQGILAAAEQGNTDGVKTWYQFVIRPEMWVMTLKQDSRIFQDTTVPHILETLLNESHIKYDKQLYHPEEHLQRAYTTQKRETMYDFWCRLAAEEGINFWFEEGPQLFYSDRHLGMRAGISLTYNPQSDTDITDSTATTWRYVEQLCSDIRVDKDYNQLRPSYPLSHQVTGEVHQQHEIFESYGRFEEDAQGQPFNQIRYEQSQNQRQVGSATTNCIELAPGRIFTLSNHPSARMNTTWQVISISHHGVQPLADNSGGEGTQLSNQLSFVPSTQEWRPPYRFKPTADGDELATVVGPPGEEIYTNEQGAVTVYFHWDRRGKPDHSASCWVRVAQGWNGDGFGFMAIPRVGQEVIISYLNNDIDKPIITGCTYNGRNRSPIDLPKHKTRTTFRTKTHKGDGFNELRFEDKNGDEEIYLHAQKNLAINVLNSRGERINYDRTTSIGHDDELVVANNRTVTVEGNQAHKTTGNFQNKIEGDQHISISGDLVEAVQGVVSTDAQGDITLQSSSKITLKVGGSFVVIHSGGVDIKGPSINLNSGGSPGDILQATNPAVLKAAASSGAVFVAHCPMKEGQEEAEHD
ncbi:TPA: type VI secretion system Vgr family protein [Proteus mirabilis]|uniref:type VI secretion system Vgr family protein n=1 Tax=Proteus mirabilis TaxID=584 RepID=UPI00028319FE|nr:type VI secretion system tip protein TssI/VgrG [Proteus mirabilis]AWR59816.1 type VI secretion system tip protein VgrG [Proteus mirabilis]EKB00183.1 type VI secretion system Vgr family protein [Proteus mirabilis WGLW4]MCS6726366.1 type VI secretion system tip protein VgrG [Proteus mirabilis]MCU9597202.1 type VI secretion system tip protein VgrG [Proteus mirabilis]MDF7301502.1 type VI secretion system tip protein VgrG [Proteus mirabilis]